MSSTELTPKIQEKQQQQPQLNNKKKRLSGLEYFKNLEKKNDGTEKIKQAGPNPVEVKVKITSKTKQNQTKPEKIEIEKQNQNQIKGDKADKTDKTEKIAKIDKYLVEQNPRQIKMSLREKIEKFSSKSPPKLPPNGEKLE